MENRGILFWSTMTLTLILAIYVSVRVMMVTAGSSPITRISNITFSPDPTIIDKRRVVQLMNLQNNVSVYELDMDIMVEHIQTIPEIEYVSIARHPNGNLTIRIRERATVAFWKSDNKYYPLDEMGRLIDRPISERPENLPLFIGAQPTDVSKIIKTINNHAILMDRVASIELVEDRRWNINLSSGTTIMLPETDIDTVLKNLAKYQQRALLLDREIERIDLRDKNRILVR